MTITRPLPPDAELIARLPETWTPTPPELRALMLAPCSRCDHIAWLRIGPGDALCLRCERAERADRAKGWTR